MRLYTTLLLSTLLLTGTAVRAQSFEPHSPLSSDTHSIKELLAERADNQTAQANNENDISPERGSGR